MPAKSNKKRPAKPRPTYPLTWHPAGTWCKKIRGRVHYFGKDAAEAEARYNREREFLEAGLPVPETFDGLTVRGLCNHFMARKEAQRDSGEIGDRHYNELHDCCKRILDAFKSDRVAASLTPRDFERLRDALAKRFGAVRLGNEITKVRSVFNYGFEAGLLKTPVRFGPSFKGPSRSVLRRERASKPKRLFARDELLLMLMAAREPVECMLLLGVNCGLGNHDVAALRIESLDLRNGWLDFPRPKTGIERRIPLWPETVTALRETIGDRKAGLVFQTRFGNPFVGEKVAAQVGKLLREIGIHRAGVGFYALRHVVQTVGGDAKDPDALRAIMGHADESISAHYREGIPDERLRAVVEHVRGWLFGQGGEQ